MAIYGIVTRYPKPSEEIWLTQAFDSIEDPEGGFLYEFSESNGWRQPIMTRMDLKFFLERPKDYGVEQVTDRPQRPQRPTPVEAKPVDGAALMSEKRIPAPEPKPVVPEERKRMGRPPKNVSVPTVS